MKHYHAFGLFLRSPLECPELTEVPHPSQTPDVLIEEGPTLSTPIDSSQFLIEKHTWVLRIKEIGEFRITSGSQVYIQRQAQLDDDSCRLFLLGSCMGAILLQRGYTVLHGNAISTDGNSCHIVVGHQGAGKSTRAAYHYTLGHQILADDICAITWQNGQPIVIPSFPQIKLWQDSADLLEIPTQSLRQIRPSLPKFALPIHDQFMKTPLPLRCIYELTSETNTPTTSLKGTDKLNCLIQHSYRYGFLEEIPLRVDYQQGLAKLANHLPIEKVARLALH